MIGEIGTIIGIGVAISGIWMTGWTVRVDRRRQKRQATIEQWMDLADRRRDLRDQLGKYRSTYEPLTVDDPFWLEYDNDITVAYRRILGDLEFFAVGVNTGTYDLATLDRMSGRSVVRSFTSARPLIVQLRARNETAYDEFERMAWNIAKRRGLVFDRIGEEEYVSMSSDGETDLASR